MDKALRDMSVEHGLECECLLDVRQRKTSSGRRPRRLVQELSQLGEMTLLPMLQQHTHLICLRVWTRYCGSSPLTGCCGRCCGTFANRCGAVGHLPHWLSHGTRACRRRLCLRWRYGADRQAGFILPDVCGNGLRIWHSVSVSAHYEQQCKSE